MNYDLVVVVRPSLDQAVAKEKLQSLLEKEGFSVSEFESLGKKMLAYPIKKEKEGSYFSMVVASSKAKPQQIYARFKLEDGILRSLVLKRKERKEKISKS